MERHKTGEPPVVVSHAVFEGLDLLRKNGRCNMFDVPCVLALAEELDQSATAIWMRARRDDYARGLLNGFRPVDNFWTAKLSDMEWE